MHALNRNCTFAHFWHLSLITSTNKYTSSSCHTLVLCFGTPRVHFAVVSVSCLTQSLDRPSLSSVQISLWLLLGNYWNLWSHKAGQLNPEVGHMIRWVTGADGSRPHDDQRNQVSAPHFIKNTISTENNTLTVQHCLRWHNSSTVLDAHSCDFLKILCNISPMNHFSKASLSRHKLNLGIFSRASTSSFRDCSHHFWELVVSQGPVQWHLNLWQPPLFVLLLQQKQTPTTVGLGVFECTTKGEYCEWFLFLAWNHKTIAEYIVTY